MEDSSKCVLFEKTYPLSDTIVLLSWDKNKVLYHERCYSSIFLN